MTQEQAEQLALEIITEVRLISGCDEESAEEVESKRIAVTILKIVTWIKNNP